MNPAALTLPAPAKINLFLHVTGRRADGYHLLESVFVPITLADSIRLTRRDDADVRLLNPHVGLNADNELACRAARALQLASGSKAGVDIEIVKRIPQGAGLGGGSSDAATTLLGLNRLWNLKLPRVELQQIGATLGADVPFFVFGKPALVGGVGELLRAVTLPALHMVVASPGAPVATAAVFGHGSLTRDTVPLNTPVFPLRFGGNDLQAAATDLVPAIAHLQHAFLAAGAAPRMTGSGSCVFALAHHASHAKLVLAALRQSGWQAWAVHTLAKHPLYGFADGAII